MNWTREMKMKALSIFIFLLFLFALSCNPEKDAKNSKASEVQIRLARQRSNQAIQDRDTAALASIWTRDYHVITSRNFEATGRTANRDRFESEFTSRHDVIYVRTPKTIEVFDDWNMASETGTWKGRWTEKEAGGDRPVQLEGSYFAKWHRLKGKWLIRAEIFVPLKCSGGKFCQQLPDLSD